MKCIVFPSLIGFSSVSHSSGVHHKIFVVAIQILSNNDRCEVCLIIRCAPNFHLNFKAIIYLLYRNFSLKFMSPINNSREYYAKVEILHLEVIRKN